MHELQPMFLLVSMLEVVGTHLNVLWVILQLILLIEINHVIHPLVP